MTNGSSDRLDRIEALLQQSVIASDERMTRIEQRLEQSMAASNERMTRFEQGLEETRQLVHSNNRFLEAFSTKIDRYTNTMDNLANRIDNLVTRIDGVIATSNQDRQESNSRLAVIQRQVSAIAKHLGIELFTLCYAMPHGKEAKIKELRLIVKALPDNQQPFDQQQFPTLFKWWEAVRRWVSNSEDRNFAGKYLFRAQGNSAEPWLQSSQI